MDWLVPDISIVLATLTLIVAIFLIVGRHLQVRAVYFRLWTAAWALSIVHYAGQLLEVSSQGWARLGDLTDRVFLACSAITFLLAAESLRGRSVRRLLPWAAGAAAFFIAWALLSIYGNAARVTAPYGVGLGVLFALAGVSHRARLRREYGVGALLLSYTFFWWALCFFVFTALRHTSFFANNFQYAYQFSNLPKVVAALCMIIFLLEEERAAVREQRDFSERLIDHAPEGILLLDEGLRVTRANARLAELCGRGAGQLLGEQVCRLFAEAEADVCRANFAEALAGGERSFQSKLAGEGDGARDVLVTASPVRSRGAVAGAMALVMDITERLSLQRQLHQSEKMASIGRLVSGVAHELNNPLTSVIGFTELAMRDASLGETTAKRLQVVLNEAQRTRSIVQKLLKSVRQQSPRTEPVDVNQLAEQTAALREPDCAAGGVELVTDLAPGLPLVSADPGGLQQVFVNLLQNSFDALSENGGGRVTLRTRAESDRVRVEFIDDGPGMSDPRKVFDPFYTTKEVGKGTGLGLSISYQLVKSFDGEITAENLARGAKFTVRLPALNAQSFPAARDAAGEASPPGGDGRPRVLVVDDEPSILALVKDTLAAEGIASEIVATGDEAKERLRHGSFEAILTDYKMPGRTSGADLYNWVRDNLPGMELRMIFMTGNAVEPGTYEFLQSISAPVFYKPFSIDELMAEVKRLVSLPAVENVVRMPRR